MEINDLSILDTRLEGIKNAQARCRNAFFTLLLACAAIIIALWNVYFSWESLMVNELSIAHSNNEFAREVVSSETVKNWVKGQWIGLPLLGIQISISDVALFGSITVSLLTFYYFLCARRENHEIGTLIQDVINENDTILYKVYFGIRGNSVFTRISDDSAISSIKKENTRIRDTATFSNYGYLFFDYLPILTIAILIFTDIYFLTYYRSPWRIYTDSSFTWHLLSLREKIQLVLLDTFALLQGILCGFFCFGISKFNRSTTNILKEYHQILYQKDSK